MDAHCGDVLLCHAPPPDEGGRRFAQRAAVGLAVGVIAASFVMRLIIAADPTSWFAGLPWPLLRLNEFILGMALAWAIRSGWRPRLPVWMPVSLLIAYVLGMNLLQRTATTQPIYDTLAPFVSETMIALFALMICAFAMADIECRSRWSRIKPLVLLGEWSYAFYLIHATLIYLALEYIGQQHGWVGVIWIAAILVVSIACAGVLHVFVERPVESRLRNWQNGVVDRRRMRSNKAAIPDNARPVDSP